MEGGSGVRKLMWFTIGFGAACAFCAYFWGVEGLLLPAAGFAAVFLGLAVAGRKYRVLRIPALICLGIAFGLGWFHIYSDWYLSKAKDMDDRIASVTAYCSDYSYETKYGTAVDAVLYLEGNPYRAKCYVSGDIPMEPGDILEGPFRLRVTTPEGEYASAYYQGEGVFLLAYQYEDVKLTRPGELPRWTFPKILRQELLTLIDELIPADAAPFCKALLLGDRYDLDYETETAFQTSGIMHIVAVSGLHVTILFTLIYTICLKRRWLVALLGIPALALFAVVGGGSPSIVRACIMQALIIGAMLFDREYDGPSELAFACLAMLLVNPLIIRSVSFQLSAGCMMGIFLFQKKISDWLLGKLGDSRGKLGKRLKNWLAKSVSMTLSSMSLTTPLAAYYFGTVSVVGILTNLLTLWIINFIFYGIMIVCLSGGFWPSAGGALGSMIAWPVRYVLGTAILLSRIPFAAVYTASIYIVAWIIFVYVLLAVFLLMKEKRPELLAGCAVLGLCLALTASWLEPMTDNCRMTVLDVGQGQSIILQSEGKTYLVDCGGSYDDTAADLAAQRLLSQGIARLDGVILTHFDADHAGGVGYLLSRIPADMIFYPDYEDTSGTRVLLESAMAGRINPVSRDLMLSYGDTKITIFAPVIADSGNESSLAVLFQAGNCDILITGDRSALGERILLKTAQIPDLEILVAGHHGSKYSTCEELLAATTPEIVVISVGENSFGHPAQEVLGRLEKFGCAVYRTDIHGTVTFRR